MRRIFTSVLSLYWAVFFALMAAALLGEDHGVAGTVFQPAGAFFGSALPQISQMPMFANGLALGFALVSVLFVWSAATAAFDRSAGIGESEEVGRIAYTGAALAFVIELAAAPFYPAPGLILHATLFLGVLAASYVAMTAENHSVQLTTRAKAENETNVISHMALSAAHQALLPRLVASRREPESGT